MIFWQDGISQSGVLEEAVWWFIPMFMLDFKAFQTHFRGTCEVCNWNNVQMEKILPGNCCVKKEKCCQEMAFGR